MDRGLPVSSEEEGDDLPSLKTPESPSGSPPGPGNLAEIMEMARNVSNLSIAHEIVINQNFRFKQRKPPTDSLEERVMENMHRAFWDSLEAQLACNPPDYTNAIRLLQEVKETLLSLLLPAHTQLRCQINEVLDMDLIKQQAKHGALDLKRLSSYITATMASLCAPIRDEEIKRLKELTDIVSLLRETLRVLNLMKMDMVNFTIQAFRPTLLQNAAQYERAKFQEILDKQPGALEHTTMWLREALEDIRNQSNNGESLPKTISPMAVLNQAYLSLLKHNSKSQVYPETVRMDQSRMEEIKWRIEQAILMASVLLVTSNNCWGGTFLLPEFVSKLKQVIVALLQGSHLRSFDLQGALSAIGEQVVLQVNQTLCDQGKEAMNTQQASLLCGQISDIAEENNPVRTLIGSRIQSVLHTFLGSAAYKDGMPFPGGLSPVSTELAEIGRTLGQLVQYNRLVFGPYYSAILREILIPQSEVDSAEGSR
ncbi:T-complex protein 11-like protein 1 [Erpetoichthys calabaricus]|uniref:T-complex 11 n=1 Tax=Erpetoichthys calabaricus TaxID=27687 RepID=A0A8C4RPE7_ERPCA|nr:T-complex protein 11-like protein 1 [Erpetoichthys calabaricus]XP_051780611.1 T-complex protein 11-like protein 1 [Erpetoichthys calabaricus]